ncbi:MAG: YjjG family noncanonical pyrimidine nucleotidase [Muribaculaceae bacterium]|nr:YjjG family noncanonical pyrimidine nucleotidase [Muribaculaceae bacterium]
MQAIKTVFIDIDDTLWYFTQNSKVAFRHVYDTMGLAAVCAHYDRFHDIYLKHNARLWHSYHHGEIDRDFLKTERFRVTLEEAGYRGDCLALGNDMDKEYLRYLATLPTLVPGAKQLLEYLNERGYDVNVLSNGFTEVQERKLLSGGVRHLVHHLVLSDDCGITKPQRGIFDYALAVAHAQPETTVMIGDDPDTDIVGAHRAGWKTIYFDLRGIPPTPGTATATVSTLDEVTRLL